MRVHLEGTEGEGRKARWGAANPCPACGSAGFLDHIDIIDRVQFEHCPDCGHKWSQTEAELTQV